jgi:hypothetical protein
MAVLASAGCQVARVEQSVVGTLPADPVEAQMEFWHQLAERPLTSNDDALHGLLLYLDGEDPHADYAGRVATLKSRGLLPEDFAAPADEAVQRGVLAVALVQAIDEKGGLMLRLLGPTPRYATRELYYKGLYPPSTPRQTFSGAEFVGIIGRIEDYQRGNPNDRPASELPGGSDEPAADATPPAATQPQ